MARWLLAQGSAWPQPSLGRLQRATPSVWLTRGRCQHRAPFSCAVAMDAPGPEESSHKLRRCARCTACEGKGASLQHRDGAARAYRLLAVPGRLPISIGQHR